MHTVQREVTLGYLKIKFIVDLTFWGSLLSIEGCGWNHFDQITLKSIKYKQNDIRKKENKKKHNIFINASLIKD